MSQSRSIGQNEAAEIFLIFFLVNVGNGSILGKYKHQIGHESFDLTPSSVLSQRRRRPGLVGRRS